MTVIEEIAAERKRQIAAEGWTPEHDDEHRNMEMARAAMSYCQAATLTKRDGSRIMKFPPAWWPWADSWWKPTTPRRDLIKAAALIVAEIERLDRIWP